MKIDHTISNSDSLSARYLHGQGEDEFPGGGPGPGGGSQLSPWFGVTPTVADNFAISEVHLFSPSLINTLRLGWNRFSQFQKGRDANVNPITIGFNTGVGSGKLRHSRNGHRRLRNQRDGFSNLGLQYGAGGRVATSYQIADEVNWTRGAHAWKFGFNFLHNYSDYTLAGARGIFTFNGSQLGDQPHVRRRARRSRRLDRWAPDARLRPSRTSRASGAPAPISIRTSSAASQLTPLR